MLKDNGVFQIDIKNAFEFLKLGEALLIDVRTRDEFDEGNIKDSILLPWIDEPDYVVNENFIDLLKEVADFNTRVLFICRSGRRSQESAELAVKNGFVNCFNVAGGFIDANDFLLEDNTG